MRIKINPACNVVCEEHSQSRRNSAQVTVPSLRLRLSIGQAALLADHIREAVDFAQGIGDLSEEPDETARLAMIGHAIAEREAQGKSVR